MKMLSLRNVISLVLSKLIALPVSVSLQHRFQLFLRVQPRHLTLFKAGFGLRLGLQAVRQFGFTALVIQTAVAELLFNGSKRGVELFHLFFETGNLFTQRLSLGAQLRFTALLVFTCLRAVGVVFRRLLRLVLLLLHVRQPLLVVFQIAVERFDFAVVH